MALPPNIPTSFVPQGASSQQRRFSGDFGSAFALIAYAILGIVLLMAGGVFVYGRLLDSTKAGKDADLAKEKSSINTSTVDEFISLSNRLQSGEKMLDNHLALSQFFSAFDTLVPSTVRFSSLHISVGDKGAISLAGGGTAKDFNSLASLSSALASKNSDIKDAIFSNLAIDPKTNAVSFALSATLDKSLVAFSATSSLAAAAAAARAPSVTVPLPATTTASLSAPATTTGATTTP